MNTLYARPMLAIVSTTEFIKLTNAYKCIRYSTVQYDTVRYSTIQYGTVPYGKVE